MRHVFRRVFGRAWAGDAWVRLCCSPFDLDEGVEVVEVAVERVEEVELEDRARQAPDLRAL